ncbi:MAG: Wzz/FepE/Etk N-terminal domain-containing protein, partial [Stackebrandtia sp.]
MSARKALMDSSLPSFPGRTLSDYLDVARRHRRLLIGVTLAGALVGGAYAVSTPQHYEARTSVLVQPTGEEETEISQGRKNSEINLDTEAQLVKSTDVAVLAAEELGDPDADPVTLTEHVAVSVPPNTAILDISFSASSATEARDGARAFAAAYLSRRAESARSRLTEQAEATEPELAQLRDQRDELSQEMDDVSKSGSRYENLKTDRDSLDDEIADLSALRTQLRSKSESVGSGRVISNAELPRAAESPHFLVYIASGALLGLLLAAAVAAARQRFASRVWL